jgi:hypothetical protein
LEYVLISQHYEVGKNVLLVKWHTRFKRRVDLMSKQTKHFSRFKPRGSTLGFLGATAILTLAASLVGISDNPPGIFLLYGAGICLVLAIAHRWRSPDKFGFLLVGSVIGFFIMVVLHNFAEVGAEKIAHLPAIALFLSAISVVGFIMAVIICPAAVAVGLIGFSASLVPKKGA